MDDVLDVRGQGLPTLPELPKNLLELWCDDNELTELPELPDSLLVLSCANNQLTKLPTLPPHLEYLDVHENQLTTIPRLPETLQVLNINNNKLTQIPELPEGLTYESTDFRQNPYDPEFEKIIDEALDGPSWASSEFIFDRIRRHVKRAWNKKREGRNISSLLQVMNQGSQTEGKPAFRNLSKDTIRGIANFLVPTSAYGVPKLGNVRNINAKIREYAGQPPRQPIPPKTTASSAAATAGNGPAASGSGAPSSGKDKRKSRKGRKGRNRRTRKQ